MNAAIALRMLVIEASRSRDLDHAAEARQAHPPKRRPSARPVARRIGLALIRIGESLAEPAARPARAR